MISFTTDSRHGDARAPGALDRILKSKKLPLSFASAEQVHGAKVSVVSKLGKSKKFMKADGLLTESVNQPLVIFTADCVPVFLSGRQGQVVGMLHAGWRGVQKKILEKAVRIFRREWKVQPNEVLVWTGPSIGPCCFEVQWDVARYFPASRLRRGFGGRARPSFSGGGRARWTIDLEKEIKYQAKRLGVRWLVPRSLGGGGVSKKASLGCTMHGKRYYSYRRDKTNKRQVSVIMV